jgi:hypothetical protein
MHTTIIFTKMFPLNSNMIEVSPTDLRIDSVKHEDFDLFLSPIGGPNLEEVEVQLDTLCQRPIAAQLNTIS